MPQCQSHLSPLQFVSNAMSMMRATRISLRLNKISNLITIAWGIGFQCLQHSCTQEWQLPEFDGVSLAAKPCLSAKDPKQITCQAPVCATCIAACLHKHPHGAKHSKQDAKLENILCSRHLKPGSAISMDQCKSSVLGQLPLTQGQEKLSQKLCGGTPFCDHASAKIMVHYQVLLAASDTIESLFFVMWEAMEHGVELKCFHTDNGMFKSKVFVEAFKDNHQMITKSGTEAHHQNGVAEWAIGAVQAMARAMLLHMWLHWPDGFDLSL